MLHTGHLLERSRSTCWALVGTRGTRRRSNQLQLVVAIGKDSSSLFLFYAFTRRFYPPASISAKCFWLLPTGHLLERSMHSRTQLQQSVRTALVFFCSTRRFYPHAFMSAKCVSLLNTRHLLERYIPLIAAAIGGRNR